MGVSFLGLGCYRGILVRLVVFGPQSRPGRGGGGRLSKSLKEVTLRFPSFVGEGNSETET